MEVAQSCPTLRNPMDCSLPGSSIHGIFQARVLEWGAIAFSHLPTQVCAISYEHICHLYLFTNFYFFSKVEFPQISFFRILIPELVLDLYFILLAVNIMEMFLAWFNYAKLNSFFIIVLLQVFVYKCMKVKENARVCGSSGIWLQVFVGVFVYFYLEEISVNRSLG